MIDSQIPDPLPPMRAPLHNVHWCASPSPPSKRRKVSTGFDAGLFKTQRVTQHAFHDTHLLEKANNLCSKYNRLTPFIHSRRHDSASTKLASYQSGWAFQEGVEEIHNVIRDTYQRLEMSLQTLRSRADLFIDDTLSLDRWYEGGDLFCEQVFLFAVVESMLISAQLLN